MNDRYEEGYNKGKEIGIKKGRVDILEEVENEIKNLKFIFGKLNDRYYEKNELAERLRVIINNFEYKIQKLNVSKADSCSAELNIKKSINAPEEVRK